MTATFNCIDDAYRWLLREILDCGEITRPRGLTTKELIGVTLRISNVRRRIVTNARRRFSLPLAIGEFCWHLSGSDEVDALAYYAPRWRDFTEDGLRVSGSCYGKRIFRTPGGSSSVKETQWEQLVRTLDADRDSRRAVLSLWNRDFTSETKDVPCTMTVQFLVRNGRVNAVVHMRSNDAIWGVPYDVFLFTMLQEYLAVSIGVEVGEYVHMASSMHLYERHFDLAEGILDSEKRVEEEMPPMTDISQLPSFLECERALREGASSEAALWTLSSPYWRQLAGPLLDHREAIERRKSDQKRHRDPSGVTATPGN
jgi:thymidylate synthase